MCGPEGAWLCRSASLSPAPCQGPSCILAGCRPPCVPPSQASAPIAPRAAYHDHRHGLEHGFLLGLLGWAISRRRNCGGHFRPKTGSHKVCCRSKAQRLGTSTCFPLCPRKRVCHSMTCLDFRSLVRVLLLLVPARGPATLSSPGPEPPGFCFGENERSRVHNRKN